MKMLSLFKSSKNAQTRLTRYLLGELAESQRVSLEEQLLADQALYERLLLAEDDLIDAYAGGELTNERRAAFERRFGTSLRNRKQIALARGLMAAAEASAPPSSPQPARSPWSLEELVTTFKSHALVPGVAAAALFLAVAVWRQVPESIEDVAGPSMASVTLQPAVRSGAEKVPRLELIDSTRAVELQVYVEGKEYYSSFQARLLTNLGTEIWGSGEIVEAATSVDSSMIVLSPPMSVLEQAVRDQPRIRLGLVLDGVNRQGRRELIDEYELELERIP